MITNFTIKFIVDEPVAFQSFSGFAACGIFYDLVKRVDEGLAEKLHSSKRLAPWAASPIFVESPRPRIVYRSLQAPSIANVSFSIMDDKLSEVFKNAILRPDLYIDLVNVRTKVIGVSVDARKFSDLASSNPLPMRFDVKFVTPTAFRRSVYDCCPNCPHYLKYLSLAKEGKKMKKPCDHAFECKGVTMPLPLPSLMFKNLVRLWSTFSGVSLDVWGAARWAERAIVVSGFPKGIRTVRVYEHPSTNKWIVGFMGTTRFSIIEEAYKERQAKIAAALLRMAELTNIGVRRTAGLGMIRYIEPRNSEDHTSINKNQANITRRSQTT